MSKPRQVDRTFDSIMPIIAANKSDLFLISTPKGPRGVFYDLSIGENDFIKLKYDIHVARNHIFTSETLQTMLDSNIEDPQICYLNQFISSKSVFSDCNILEKFSTTTIISTKYPSHIKHVIEELEKGENLAHSERFMLVTFLLSRGQSVKQIALLFKNTPDYNEKITLHQLNHLVDSSKMD